MKKLYYDEGPLVMGCGIAGQFKIGEPREVPDDLAQILLQKGRLKEFTDPASKDRGSKSKGEKSVAPIKEG